MANKTREALETEAKALSIPDEAINATVTKADLKKLIADAKVDVDVEGEPEQGESIKEPVKGAKVVMPAQSTVVYGGPNGQPKGFTVLKGTEIDTEKYGIGKGVELHSVQDTPQGSFETYLIVY